MPHSEAGDGPESIVIALGGNALQPPDEIHADIHAQFAHTRTSLAPIIALAADGWRIAVVHGNGPQIGDELRRNELARDDVPPLPLGVLVASTAGWIGYMIQQSLENALDRTGIRRDVATIISQVLVDPDDPLTYEPVKPIGRSMDEASARALVRELSWTVEPAGSGWRRLVASPRPISIVESEQIRRLVESGTIVITAGGGGIPVRADAAAGLDGVDGVVDKDRVAQVLAREIGARVLVLLTNVEGVYRRFGSPEQELIRRMDSADAERLLAEGRLGRGSMAPKVEAALEFVCSGGDRAHIARLDQGLDAVRGEAGTTIVR